MKSVLITGATSGIGEALAKFYVDHGFSVYACGRNREKLDELSQYHEHITTLAFELNDQAAIATALDKHIELDQLILNAGTCEYIDDAKHFDGELFARVINTNVVATGYCLAAWLPQVKSGGQVGIMSSSAAYIPLTRSEAYGASKAAMTYLAQTLSVDLAHQHIGVSAIHPGFVETPLTDKNDFPMPNRISADKAAESIYYGMDKKRYDIHFPKRFTGILKGLSFLPFAIWRKLAIRMIKK
jgi:NAD(P)-dependent dehydrogenase (short-subunit alcohol dehydrogenase family)